MLDASSSITSHRLQNIVLVWLSLIFLPFDTFVLLLSYTTTAIVGSNSQENRARCQAQTGFKQRKILVTGVGMTKGLAIARNFYEAGHEVVAADVGSYGFSACGRFSKAVSKFYELRKPSAAFGSAPYIESLIDIVTRERIELWVSCSSVSSAIEDAEAKEIIEARTKCKAVQFNIETTKVLHEKDTFIERTRSIGLNIPDTHRTTNRAEVDQILRMAPPGRKYIMKTIGVVDAMRANMTLLPKSSPEQTSKHLADLPISEAVPWILQQYIDGCEYCTHSLVVRGQVKAFVACPSAEMLMHYEQLPNGSSLSQAMLQFTQHYAASEGESFTGHLSFDFLVEGASHKACDPASIVLYPIECNPRAHTAVALLNGTSSLADAYLSALDHSEKQTIHAPCVTPARQDKYHWIGHDIVEKLILPTLSLLTWQCGFSEAVAAYKEFLILFLTWKDGTYEIWDPLPWWWLYHVYWPTQFLSCVWHGMKWSRINVSTTKMFEC